MKTTIIASLAALSAARAACAADLPKRKGPTFVLPPPALLYEGFYVGAQVGVVGFADRASTLLAPNNAQLWRKTARGGGFIGGVHAGYDWRFGQIVLGLVGDASGSRARANVADPFFIYGLQSSVDAQGSSRGRVGFNYERALFYATGGLSVAHFEHGHQAPLGALTQNYVLVTATVGGASNTPSRRNRARMWNTAFLAVGPRSRPPISLARRSRPGKRKARARSRRA